MTDEDLFTTFVSATPGQLIDAVERLLDVPWNTGADAALEHTVEGMTVTSSEDADVHELEFIRSTDFAGDAGERFTAVMNRVAPVIASIEGAMTAAWGEPGVLRQAEDPRACTLFEAVMEVLGADEVLAWQRDERYILFFEGVQKDSDQYAAAFWVASRSMVEDVAYDITSEARGSDATGGQALLEQRLAGRLGPEASLPEPLCRAWSFMQAQGWGGVDADGNPILTPYPGEEQLGPVFSASLSIRGWLDPDAPGAERLVPIAETDGSGGLAAIWFDEAGEPRFVWLSSEGGEPQRLAGDPVDFLRLIAIGYAEFTEWVWGRPPDSFADTHPEEEEGGEELLASDPVTAHGQFRAWVEAEFGVEVPEVWTVSDDAEFTAWLEAMVDAHGIGDETDRNEWHVTLLDTFIQEFEAAFAGLADGRAPHEIVGIGAYTDADASGLIFAAHSKSDEAAQRKKYPDFPADAVWSIGDWDIHIDEEGPASGPQHRVDEAIDRIVAEFGDDINARRTAVWSSAVEAMAVLHQRGFFDQWPESVRAFMVMDGLVDDHDVYVWHTRFNDEARLSALPAFLQLDVANGDPLPGVEPGEDTALHRAARGLSPESVREQLDAGADPDASDSWGWTPLDLVAFGTEYWRAREALAAARVLLAVTAKKTIAAEAASHLRGEFRDAHRAHANGDLGSDHLQAFRDLLELLAVPEPVLVTPLAPGEQITVGSQGWKRQFSELWQLLVPENGPAVSVQGEVIRIAGRVGHEILTNGGGNWDEDFEAMLDAFLTFTAQGEPLPEADHDRARHAAEGLRGGQFSQEDVDEMTRASVSWVLLNPAPVPLPSQPYGR